MTPQAPGRTAVDLALDGPAVPPAPPRPRAAGAGKRLPAPWLPGLPGAQAGPRSPGGSAVGVVGTPPGASPRTWVLELPPGLKTLSPNQRLHWAEQRRRARELKKAAWVMALAQKIPHLERAAITVLYYPPDRRRRDNDNIPAASGKHCIDGIVAAKVLDDDSPAFVDGPFYGIGEIVKGGQIVLHITEVMADE